MKAPMPSEKRCRCKTRGPSVLYVGRSVMARSRLQREAFPTNYNDLRAFEWLQRLQFDPHCHMIHALVWYVPKSQLAIAETTLIETFKPRYNLAERRGFGGLWEVRAPDVGAVIDDLQPHIRPLPAPELRNIPGVYAWMVDVGEERRILNGLIAQLVERIEKEPAKALSEDDLLPLTSPRTS